jgi:uncharacterized protein (DUF1330 family)
MASLYGCWPAGNGALSPLAAERAIRAARGRRHTVPMTAYILADIDVTDPVRYEDYKILAAESVQQYGGRYVVRGGGVEVLEGTWPTNRFVILEFDDGDAARRWYASPEYTAAIAVRQESSNAKLVLVEQ